MRPTPYSYNTILIGGVDLLRSAPNQIFPVIFDSGASKAISGFKEDFVGEIIPPPNSVTLQTRDYQLLR